MTKPGEADLELPWQALLISLLPMAVFLAGDQFLNAYGASTALLPAQLKPFDGHLESAARLGVLSTFILFAGVAAAAIAALGFALAELGTSSRRKIGLGIAILAAAGTLLVAGPSTGGIAGDIGQPLFCAALEQSPTAAYSTPVQPESAIRTDEARAARAAPCKAEAFLDLLGILGLWKWVLFAATAAVVFGTICCLAFPKPPPEADERAMLLNRQAARLNMFLYLSALLMVSALLVQAAFIRWPRFALVAPSSFDAHVSSIIFYYGASYSVFLASFYLPVLVWLTRRAERLDVEEHKNEVLSAAKAGPTTMVKVATSILAPAIAGLLSAILDLPG